MTDHVADEAQGHALARLQARAAFFSKDDDFKEIVKQLKNRAIRKWSEGKDMSAREHAWHDLQAIGRLENYLVELADGKTMADRKDAAEKAKLEKVSRR